MGDKGDVSPALEVAALRAKDYQAWAEIKAQVKGAAQANRGIMTEMTMYLAGKPVPPERAEACRKMRNVLAQAAWREVLGQLAEEAVETVAGGEAG